MHPAEKNLREKAEAFKLAFLEARDAGFSVIWPLRGNEVGDIIISGTAKAVITSTFPLRKHVEFDAGSVPEGEPLDLTDEERAALPPLGDPGDGGNVYGDALKDLQADIDADAAAIADANADELREAAPAKPLIKSKR